MRHYEYPETQQFRTIAKNVKSDYTTRKDINGTSVRVVDAPTLTFHGTVKLHGTNVAVVIKPDYTYYPQSRNNVLTAEQDSYGFYAFCKSRAAHFIEIRKELERMYSYIAEYKYTIIVYGEWAGEGIQEGVGISNIERSFFIFGVRVQIVDIEYWLKDYGNIARKHVNIYNIKDFKSYCIAIDFKNPKMVQNTLAELTEKIEHECPVAKELGYPNTIGEGIVWTYYDSDGSVYRFKVKGKKHSSSKVTALAKIDIEVLNNINDFIDYAVTISRLQQGLKILFPDDKLDVVKLGEYIRWVMQDIIKEESDTLLENNLTIKQVGSAIADKVKEYFFEQYKDL